MACSMRAWCSSAASRCPSSRIPPCFSPPARIQATFWYRGPKPSQRPIRSSSRCVGAIPLRLTGSMRNTTPRFARLPCACSAMHPRPRTWCTMSSLRFRGRRDRSSGAARSRPSSFRSPSTRLDATCEQRIAGVAVEHLSLEPNHALTSDFRGDQAGSPHWSSWSTNLNNRWRSWRRLHWSSSRADSRRQRASPPAFEDHARFSGRPHARPEDASVHRHAGRVVRRPAAQLGTCRKSRRSAAAPTKMNFQVARATMPLLTDGALCMLRSSRSRPWHRPRQSTSGPCGARSTTSSSSSVPSTASTSSSWKASWLS